MWRETKAAETEDTSIGDSFAGGSGLWAGWCRSGLCGVPYET